MTTTMATSSGAHILIFPYPAHGHMLPLLDLAYHLSTKSLAITIVVTPSNLTLIQPLLSSSPSIQPLVLPLPESPTSTSIEHSHKIPVGSFGPLMHSLSLLHDPLLIWFSSHPSPPVAIISDVFLGWTVHLARRLHIPRIMFTPSFAKATAFADRLWLSMPSPPNPVSFPDLPNSPKYRWSQISLVFRSYKRGDSITEFIKDSMLANQFSWGTVYNSFTELERIHLDHSRRELGHSRLWAVGPLCLGSRQRLETKPDPSLEFVLSWLDGSHDGSVVYIGFGSQAVLTNSQMAALAEGLERSGAQFLWVTKGATAGHAEGRYGAVPEGFEEKVEGRGVVVKGWAPQVAILSHRAVGVFVTHCGANSVIEAVAAGVPMLAWPMTADQHLNASMVSEELGVARRICDGEETVPEPGKLARILAEAIGGMEPERARTMKLSRAAHCAVREGGTSFQDMDDLAKQLCELSSTKTSTLSDP